MSNSVEKRQEVRDKIKASGSKYKYIYSEMKRLGFWDEGNANFSVIEDYFDKETKLKDELHKLFIQKKKLDDPEAVLREIHKKRKKESKQRQKETKERKEAERIARQAEWERKKKEEITFLGSGYSNTLNDRTCSPEMLSQRQLPLLEEACDLAKAMKISVGTLRFLAFSRKNSTISHYKRFTIPKRNGGTRIISAPKPRLKSAQYWILENILNKIAVHEAAQGCVSGRSIKTNAQKHLGQEVLINQDLKDFFPSITYRRIKGLFVSFGYSKSIATILALICTEPKIKEVDVFGKEYYAQYGERFLPQGSPCSPALTNILCRNLDSRLSGLGQKYGFTYTRYVDDISFSTSGSSKERMKEILLYSKRIIAAEGFHINPEKLRIMRKGNRQHVTGLLVNEKPNVDKKTLKRFRALIYQIEKDGINGKEWNGKKGKDILPSIDGFASFVNQINPTLGAIYKPRVLAIINKYGYKAHNPYRQSTRKHSTIKRFFSKLFRFKK